MLNSPAQKELYTALHRRNFKQFCIEGTIKALQRGKYNKPCKEELFTLFSPARINTYRFKKKELS